MYKSVYISKNIILACDCGFFVFKTLKILEICIRLLQQFTWKCNQVTEAPLQVLMYECAIFLFLKRLSGYPPEWFP